MANGRRANPRGGGDDIPENFSELIADPRTGKLRPPSKEGQGGPKAGPPRPKGKLQYMWDVLSAPGPNLARRDRAAAEIRRQKMSKIIPDPDDPNAY